MFFVEHRFRYMTENMILTDVVLSASHAFVADVSILRLAVGRVGDLDPL